MRMGQAAEASNGERANTLPEGFQNSLTWHQQLTNFLCVLRKKKSSVAELIEFWLAIR